MSRATLTTPTEKLIARSSKVLWKHISPPREITFLNNLLQWDPPADVSNVTHTFIRIEHDHGNPDYSLPVQQTSLQLWRGNTFVLSSFNAITGQESERVLVGADYTLGLNVNLGDFQGGIAISAIAKALSDPTDFGIRFWLVTTSYTSDITDLQSVAVWVENPTDDEPEKVSTLRYIPGQSNDAIIAMNPPETDTEIRVYLVPITTAKEYELKTVADYGESDSSAHDEITLTTVPDDTQGVEYCENVSAWDVSEPPTYFYDANGLYRGKVAITFTPPTDARWGGVEVVIKKPGPRYVSRGRFNASPTGDIEVEVPPTVESWRIFARSFDKQGKLNTINEGGGGTPTPYDDISIGDTSGKLDLGKALAASVGTALEVVANVLGVQDEGITTDLIGAFAVSQAKLANAPIIDAVRIVDGAVTNAKIESLAANKILAGSLAAGVILTSNLSAIQITTGTMAAERVGAGTMTVGSGGITMSGTGGLTIAGSGSLSVTLGNIYALGAGFKTGGLGWDIVSGGSGYITGNGYVNANAGYKVNGGTVIDSSKNADFANCDVTGSYQMDGTDVISSSRHGKFNELHINAVQVIDFSRNIAGASLDVSGNCEANAFRVNANEVIDSSRNADFVSLKIGGTTTIFSSGAVIVRYFSQAGRPTLEDGEGAQWWDTSNMNWLIRKGANYFKVQMTSA